jgi:hypothetical protein
MPPLDTLKKITPSYISSHGSSAKSKSMRTTPWHLFRMTLPTGWENFYNARRCGAAYGLRIECPCCGATPPRILEYSYRMWRWINVHMAKEHCANQALRHRRIAAAEKRRKENAA